MIFTKEQIMQIQLIQIRIYQITGKSLPDNKVLEIALNVLEESLTKNKELAL